MRKGLVIFWIVTNNEEATVDASQKYPLIALKPVYPTDRDAAKFVQKKSVGCIQDKDTDKIDQIVRFTGKHFLMMDEALLYCDLKNLEESLKTYETKKLLHITTDLRRFFKPSIQIQQDLVDRRKIAMMTVLYTLLSGPEGSMSELKLPARFEGQCIDQRYFIDDEAKCTMKAINPLATSALKQILDDLDNKNSDVIFYWST